MNDCAKQFTINSDAFRADGTDGEGANSTPPDRDVINQRCDVVVETNVPFYGLAQ